MGSQEDVFQCLLGHLQFRKVLNILTLELLYKIIIEVYFCYMGLRFTHGSSLEYLLTQSCGPWRWDYDFKKWEKGIQT